MGSFARENATGMALLFTDPVRFYTWAIEENGDPRTRSWFLIESPWPIISIFLVYVIVSIQGPKIMEQHKPVNLKNVLIVYNFFLVGMSIYMFHEYIVSAVLSGYSLSCQPVDYSDDPLAVRIANVCWWYFISKIIELLDTVFIILRKKNNQISFLHVYHHSSMLFNWWLGVRYVAGGQSLFHALNNTFVHIIMYSYYALAAMGPHMQKYLWWKKYITKLQLIQFVALVIHTGWNLFIVDCDFPTGFNILCFTYAISLLVLFSNFYLQAYIKKRQQKVQ